VGHYPKVIKDPRLTIVVVGRPNVGKSTLFNRLTEKRRAITSPIAGTTRDWIEGVCHWNGRSYRVIDTGGYAPGSEDVLSSVRAQVEAWLEKADAVLWVVDAGEGLTAQDQAFARLLRPRSSRVVLAVNKADDAGRDGAFADFATLGFSRLVTISATHGRRVNVLLEAIENLIGGDLPGDDAADPDEVAVSLVGRPNVGKSSLANRLLGEDRMIVSAVPGTTRDTVDTRFAWNGRSFRVVDTAGLRAKKSRADNLENLTRLMTERALDRSDVALLLVDAGEGLTEGDVAVGRLIDEKRRACVLGVNKWDRVTDHAPTAKYYRDRAPEGMPFLSHSPIVFLSAKTGHHIEDLLAKLAATRDEYHRRFDDEELTAFFWKTVQERPYNQRGQKLVFHSARQVAVAPPTFVLRTSLEPEDIHFSYERRLDKVFRAQHGLAGVPIHFKFKRGKS
jgi:GTP-binding protein